MIGMFDSGLGGLSVWKTFTALHPTESVIYLADRAFCPYGERSQADILARSEKITEHLIQAGADLIVIACNTATSAAAKALRQRYPQLPIVGMEPAIKPAALASHSKQIGVLATEATLKGDKFHLLAAQYVHKVKLHLQAGHGFVELVEAGLLDGETVEKTLQDALAPWHNSPIDQVVLGCTHYPFLAPVLQKILGDQVTLIDPAEAVSRQIMRLLPKPCANGTKPRYEFETTANADSMSQFIQTVLQLPNQVKTVSIE